MGNFSEQVRGVSDDRRQQHRIALTNQLRAQTNQGGPTQVIGHFASQTAALEQQMVSVLGAWAAAQPAGQWAQGQKGIGPILSAALLANINIRIARTAGAIWRFAGLDTTLKWYGKAAADLVDAAFRAEPSPLAALCWLAAATTHRIEDLIAATGNPPADRTDALRAVQAATGATHATITELFAQRPLHTDHAISHACQQLSTDPAAVYHHLYAGLQIEPEPLVKVLSKRPTTPT